MGYITVTNLTSSSFKVKNVTDGGSWQIVGPSVSSVHSISVFYSSPCITLSFSGTSPPSGSQWKITNDVTNAKVDEGEGVSSFSYIDDPQNVTIGTDDV
jgi:hypothetical protein